LCLLDPTGRGETAYNVLRYCSKQGIENVCLIDPYHYQKYQTVPVINPLDSRPWRHKASVANVMDAMRVIFGVKDPSGTNVIEFYMPAILRALLNAEATLTDSKYFTVYSGYEVQRAEIMTASVYDKYEKFRELDDNWHRRVLQGAFKSEYQFNQTLGSTVRRLSKLYGEPLKWIFGSNEAHHDGRKLHKKYIDFTELIRDNWVILVNLDTQGGADVMEMRFLGTIIINEIITAWKGWFNLYIDEAQDFANMKLAEILDKKRKLNLRLVLSHQHPDQFEDRRIYGSVDGGTKLKAAFYMADSAQRERIAGKLYGGKLSSREVAHNLSDQRKQTAVIKNGKTAPQLVTIEDVPDAEVDDAELERYILWLYKRPWYKSPRQVEEEIRMRFYVKPEVKQETKKTINVRTETVRPKSSRKGKVADGPPASSPKERPKTPFDD
jgi:hypothetical protein